MRQGERPDGKELLPAFPYTSFTKIVDRDLRDSVGLPANARAQSRANQEHQMRFPFGWRFLVTFWKWFFFTPGPFTKLPGLLESPTAGAYLVQALGHCGECHTPRQFPRRAEDEPLPRGGKGPDGKDVANLTPSGLKKWSDKELEDILTTGIDRKATSSQRRWAKWSAIPPASSRRGLEGADRLPAHPCAGSRRKIGHFRSRTGRRAKAGGTRAFSILSSCSSFRRGRAADQSDEEVPEPAVEAHVSVPADVVSVEEKGSSIHCCPAGLPGAQNGK